VETSSDRVSLDQRGYLTIGSWLNRFGKFSRRLAYRGWGRGLYGLEWFDSAPERTFANLVDSEDKVSVWTRIQRSELTVEWEGARYSPDFTSHIARLTTLLRSRQTEISRIHLCAARKLLRKDGPDRSQMSEATERGDTY
jgi:hypothetical protein